VKYWPLEEGTAAIRREARREVAERLTCKLIQARRNTIPSTEKYNASLPREAYTELLTLSSEEEVS